jgi:DNA primase
MEHRSGDFKSQVLTATDIVQLIGQSVALKRRGKDYVGLCPFHTEKTGSFYVSPSKQFYHCYGCKKHGNAIDFVIERDRVDFKEALMLLGRQAGLEMPKFGLSKEKTGERQGLLEAHSAACSFFEKLLSDPKQGEAARAYLLERQISAESIKRFQIGYAADSWNALLNGPVGKKFPPRQLELGGLVKANTRGDGFYDTFRNRLIFPIKDEVGRIIAFGGRVMPRSQDPAKYLNSPETPLFSKGRCVFGLDLAKGRIVETRRVAVVEGYADVVMAHQFGISNVVSILGTAMTEQHVGLLKRFADRIVLLFDPDTAGETAVDRVVELFLRQPVEIAIASLPDGLDPDEFLLAHGAAAFEKVLDDATDALAYKWKALSRRFVAETGDLTGQQKAVEAYLEVLAQARGGGPVDAMRWGSALARVSRLLEIPVEDLHRRFKAKRPARSPAGMRSATGPASATATEAGASEGSKAGEATALAGPGRPLTGQDRAERAILGILLAAPGRWFEVQQHVLLEDFANPFFRKMADLYWGHQRDEGEPVFSEFLGILESVGLGALAVELLEEAETMGDVDMVLAGAVGHLHEVRRLKEEQKHLAALRRTKDEKVSEEEEIARLREFAKNNQPNLHRLGPVRRFGS